MDLTRKFKRYERPVGKLNHVSLQAKNPLEAFNKTGIYLINFDWVILKQIFQNLCMADRMSVASTCSTCRNFICNDLNLESLTIGSCNRDKIPQILKRHGKWLKKLTIINSNSMRLQRELQTQIFPIINEHCTACRNFHRCKPVYNWHSYFGNVRN